MTIRGEARELLEVPTATVHAILRLVFPVGIEVAVFVALLRVIFPMPIKMRIIGRLRVGELVGSVCKRFHCGGVFFELGGGGDEWMRKHNEEKVVYF
jgi:hypothetical protein